MSDWRREAGIPRRACADLREPIEDEIQPIVDAVEMLGAHPLLTDAVILLGQARDKLADWIDAGRPGASK